MSTPSAVLEDFEDWLDRGLTAASALDAAAIEVCNEELELLAEQLPAVAADPSTGRAILERVRDGVARWRDACRLAASVLEEVLSAGTGGAGSTFYRRDGAMTRAAALGRVVKSYG
jgi:hypothetical protein